MVFSKLYYDVFAGPRVKTEQSSFVAVNPLSQIGEVLFVGSCAERAAIGGQVASKLSLQHFIEGAQNVLKDKMPSNQESPQKNDIAMLAMEEAFRTANSAVYEFGHKLSAGGRMAASLISIYARDGFIAAGRVGHGVAYLARAGEVFPFFSPKAADQEVIALGANSIVSVELASVNAEPGDVVLTFSEAIPSEEELELGHSVALLLPKFDQVAMNNPASLDKYCERLTQKVFGVKSPAFSSILGFGPEVTFLDSNLRIAA